MNWSGCDGLEGQGFGVWHKACQDLEAPRKVEEVSMILGVGQSLARIWTWVVPTGRFGMSCGEVGTDWVWQGTPALQGFKDG